MSEANKNVFLSVGRWVAFMILIYIANLVVDRYTDYEFIGNYILEYPVIYTSIISIVLACVSGYSEAWYWYFKGERESNYNEHFVWTISRAVTYFLIYRHLDNIAVTFALACMFPFFHDGYYYMTRNRIDHTYSKGWFDYSYTSTSKIDLLMKGFNRTLPGIIRTTIFIISFAFLIYHYGRG